MATLFITEYQTAASDQGRALPLGHGFPVAKQVLGVGGVATQSQPFSKYTHFVRLHADTICSYLVGTAASPPTATTSDARMAANQTEYFGVDPGMLISVIANA